MFKIVIQNLDYDDYPMGQPVEIGPFANEAVADRFMEDSSKFNRVCVWSNYYEWRVTAWRTKHRVGIVPVTDNLKNPADWA